MGDGIVRHSLKDEKTERILLGAVAWIDLKRYCSFIQECMSVIPLSRGSLRTFVYGNPELARAFGSGQV